MIFRLLNRDILLAIKSSNGLLMTVAILLISTALYSFLPEAKSSDYDFFTHNILITLTFAALLPINIIFFGDLEDGSLEQIILSGASAEEIFTSKVLFHFLMVLMPLVIATPFMASMFKIQATYFMYVLLLIAGGFSFTAVYTGLIVSLLGNNILVGVLVALPLMITQLIVAKLAIVNLENLTLLIGLVLVVSAIVFLMGVTMLKDRINKPL
jgi:heme exporter protein B